MNKTFLFLTLCMACAGATCAAEANSFFCKPFLSHPGNCEITINWSGSKKWGGAVEYRKKGETEYKTKYNLFGGIILYDFDHRITLSGLEPDTYYEYRVLPVVDPSGFSNQKEMIGSGSFKTFSANQDILRLWVTSDLQQEESRVKYLPELVKHLPFTDADMIISVGDNNNFSNSMERDFLQRGIVGQIQKLSGENTPLILARGNHEWRGSDPYRFVRMFGDPQTQKSYFSLKCGKDLLIFLDSAEDKADLTPGHVYTNKNRTPELMEEQKAWLKKLVKSPEFSEARYRIVFVHIPPYGGGEKYGAKNVQSLFDAFDKNKIHLVMSGHEHYYVRGLPGSKELSFYRPEKKYVNSSWRQSGEKFDYPVILQDGPGYGGAEASASLVTLSSRGIEVKTVVPDGKVIDHLQIDPFGKIRIIDEKELVHYAK